MARRYNVLVVDDDPCIVDLVRILLESEGFSMESAQDGRQALHTIEQDQPDIVLMDVMMPVMDGVTCCAEMRKNPSTSKLPVLFMSAATNLQGRLREIGADGFISKPFDLEDLLSLLKAHLGARLPLEQEAGSVLVHH